MEVVKALLEKISNFFDLFDISYLVSGVATLGILSFLPHSNRLANALPDGFNGIWWFIVCYALGLALSSAGRSLNQFIASLNEKDHLDKYKHFESVLIATKLDINPWFHGMLLPKSDEEKTKRYQEPSLKNVYRLMWTALRERKDVPESMILLRKYWVSSSTLDGLTVSAIIGVLVSGYSVFLDWSDWRDIFCKPSFWLMIALSHIVYRFSHEANRNRRYQIEELVNTYILVKGI